MGPRDALPALAVPVNVLTGRPVTDRQARSVNQIREAGDALLNILHEAEGTMSPGEHQEHEFQTRRMALAHTHIEQALMFAFKEVLK